MSFENNINATILCNLTAKPNSIHTTPRHHRINWQNMHTAEVTVTVTVTVYSSLELASPPSKQQAKKIKKGKKARRENLNFFKKIAVGQKILESSDPRSRISSSSFTGPTKTSLMTEKWNGDIKKNIYILYMSQVYLQRRSRFTDRVF